MGGEVMNDDNALKLQPPRRVTIVESIIEQIVSLIQDGTLKPGDKLPSERKLMEMLSVSRSTVREALQGLAAMGLMEGRIGEGTFVKETKPHLNLDMDIATLSSTLQKEMRHHLNQARLILEQDIVTLAAEKVSEEARQVILQALEDYELHSEFASEEEGWSAHDHLHLTIAEVTGNPILVQILGNLLELVPDSLRQMGARHGTPEKIAEQAETERSIHRQLCEAVIRGDAPAAREWMRRHAESERKVIDAYYGHEV